MEKNEFINSLFSLFSNQGFVQTFKTQLRLSIHKKVTSSRNYSFEPFQHNLWTEIICNIISEYLKKKNLIDTLHLFMEESGFHEIEEKDIFLNIGNISKNPTILENLLLNKKIKNEFHSISCQNEEISLEQKLSLIDETIKKKRLNYRSQERLKIIKDRLNQIKKEKEIELEKRIKHSFESQKLFEFSKIKIESENNFKIKLNRLKLEFDEMFQQRSRELKLLRENEEESTKLLELELNRQLSRVQNDHDQLNKIHNFDTIKQECNNKLQKSILNLNKLIKKRNLIKERILLETESHEKSLEELNKLQNEFNSLKI